eukprot:1149323-Pelagomonas_calceolata.AAC.1
MHAAPKHVLKARSQNWASIDPAMFQPRPQDRAVHVLVGFVLHAQTCVSSYWGGCKCWPGQLA